MVCQRDHSNTILGQLLWHVSDERFYQDIKQWNSAQKYVNSFFFQRHFFNSHRFRNRIADSIFCSDFNSLKSKESKKGNEIDR